MSSRLINTAPWPRRATHDHFRGYSQPWFSVCVAVDVAPLWSALRGRGGFSIACHHMALMALRGLEPLRMRFHGDAGVQLLDTVHAGTTVLREDESFTFATLHHEPSYTRFEQAARAALAAARAGAPPPQPEPEAHTLMHCTTLPWLHFSSFSHARDRGPGEDIPKLAFGQVQGGRLPLAIDVHHALVDGLHVARYVQAFEALARDPLAWLEG